MAKLKRFYCLTFSGEGIPVALMLQKEGVECVVGTIQDNKDILTGCEKHKPEDPEEKKRRLSLGGGMVKVVTAEKLVRMAKSDPNPKEAFWFTDFNHGFVFAEQVMGIGMPGLFPTEEDRMLEVNRDDAKKFVEKNYPKLKVAEHHDFKTAKEGIAFLGSTYSIWCLKGCDEDAPTTVPDTDNVDIARNQLIDSLSDPDKGKKFEKSGYLLEEKITNPVEITPEAIFYDGKLLCVTIDLELKRKNDGELGRMSGCAADLVFPIDTMSKIVNMAFPPVVYKMAKSHKGMFIWDASLLFDPKTGEPYMGEFCANRPGYNAFYDELALLDEKKEYFE